MGKWIFEEAEQLLPRWWFKLLFNATFSRIRWNFLNCLLFFWQILKIWLPWPQQPVHAPLLFISLRYIQTTSYCMKDYLIRPFPHMQNECFLANIYVELYIPMYIYICIYTDIQSWERCGRNCWGWSGYGQAPFPLRGSLQVRPGIADSPSTPGFTNGIPLNVFFPRKTRFWSTVRLPAGVSLCPCMRRAASDWVRAGAGELRLWPFWVKPRGANA